MKLERSQEAMERIDRGIEDAAAITIEQALEHAVETGNMTIKESELCLDAYRKAFLGEPEEPAKTGWLNPPK